MKEIDGAKQTKNITCMVFSPFILTNFSFIFSPLLSLHSYIPTHREKYTL